MELITAEIREKLLENARRREEDEDYQAWPVVKLFDPAGAGTWLISEMDPECEDYLFGLADLGMDCAELGTILLSELVDAPRMFGLGIERDRFFEAKYPLIVYARAGWAARRIVERGPELERLGREHNESHPGRENEAA